MRAVYRNGVPDSVNSYSTPNHQTLRTREPALYVQDRWRSLENLTTKMGIRFDAITSDAAATCVDAARLPRRITVVATVIESVAMRLNRIEDL